MAIRSMKFTPEALIGAPRRSSAVPNAAGTFAVYTQTSYCIESHSKTNEIRVVEIGSGQSALITNDSDASNPQWLGDGDQLVWLKTEANGKTSFVIGDAREADKTYIAGVVPGPVSDLKVTLIEPGKIGFAVSGKANPDGSLNNPYDARKPVTSGKLYTSLYARQWDMYVEPQKNAIWYGLLEQSPLTPARSQAGKYGVVGLTYLIAVSGLTGVESPVPPFGGTGDFDISPSAIVFIAKDPYLDPATHDTCSCYYAPISSWTSMSTLDTKICKVEGLRGAMASPVLSSDGGSIAVLATRNDGYDSDKNRILYIPNPWNGEIIEVFSSAHGKGLWPLSPSAVSFSYDNKSLLIQVEETGRGVLYQLPLDHVREATPDALKRLTYSGYVNDVVPAAANSPKLFVSSSSLLDSSLWTVIDPSHPEEARVVSLSGQEGAAFGLSRTQVDEIWWKGSEGHPVHAWVVKPSHFKPGERYPLAYLIHGGPQSAWTDQWNTNVRLNLAVFAEQGYVVIAPNPTGSTGYGQAFTDAVRGEWGGRPYEDLVKGFEYIEQNLEYIDTQRAVAVGTSYGGFMVNWIQGHPLGRKFKALVTHAGVFSMVGLLASEDQFFMQHNLKGPIWEVPKMWEKWDPSRFTGNWQTPHLIVHNELDYRLTIAEGLAAFNVLQMRGIDSAFLTFPDENHFVLKPENSLLWHRTVLNWINKYVALPAVSDKPSLPQDMASLSIRDRPKAKL